MHSMVYAGILEVKFECSVVIATPWRFGSGRVDHHVRC